MENLAESNSEKVMALTEQINQIITRGRPTIGPAQPNDTRYWKDLIWLQKSDYESMSVLEPAAP